MGAVRMNQKSDNCELERKTFYKVCIYKNIGYRCLYLLRLGGQKVH